MNNSITFFLLAIIGLVSCKKKETDDPILPPIPEQLEVHLLPKLDGQNYIADQIIESPQGYRYYFSDIKILGTDIANGSNILADNYLYNFRSTGTLIKSSIGDNANFSNLSLNIGVGSALNHADPSVPASSSALNISNSSDMHWGWNPGYIFVKLEGKVDTTDNGVDDFNHIFVYHLGMDQAFRSVNFSGINWLAMSEAKFKTNLNLSMKEILDKPGDEIDLRLDYISHSSSSQMALSNRIMDLFVNAISKE